MVGLPLEERAWDCWRLLRGFELARKIEDMAGWRPGSEGGALEGKPKA